MNQLWSEMNVKCSHTHNNNHRLQKLTKRSQQSGLLPESQCSGPPKGLSFTGLRTQLKSSARNTLSNQQAQPKEAETVNLTENVAKDTFKGSLVDCQEDVPYTALTIV